MYCTIPMPTETTAWVTVTFDNTVTFVYLLALLYNTDIHNHDNVKITKKRDFTKGCVVRYIDKYKHIYKMSS